MTGPPHFKFYAGTPLTTENGVNIGSLFIIDDRVRPELTEDQVDCMGTIAKIVMQTMQLNSEAAERKRSLRMSLGLQSFQDGKDSIEFEDQNGSSVDYDLVTKQGEDGGTSRANGNDPSIRPDGDKENSQDLSAHPENAEKLVDVPPPARDPRPNGDTTQKPSQDMDQTPNSTFVRAANLLRESLDLQATGGVVFYDAGVGYHGRDAAAPDLEGSEDDLEKSPRKRKKNSASSISSHEHGSSKYADVIGFSTAEIPLGTQKELGKVRSFSLLTEHLLQQLLQRYPRGKMWSFDEDGNLADEGSFSAFGRSQCSNNVPTRSQRRQAEARHLCRYFPNGECAYHPRVNRISHVCVYVA